MKKYTFGLKWANAGNGFIVVVSTNPRQAGILAGNELRRINKVRAKKNYSLARWATTDPAVQDVVHIPGVVYSDGGLE